LPSPIRIPHAPRWRFSLRSLFLAIALISFVIAWLRWFWTDSGWVTFYPGFYGICSIGVLLLASFQLRSTSGCPSAWNWVAVAWFIVLGNVYYGFFRFTGGSYTPDAEVMARRAQDGLYLAIVSAITVPLFCTIPTLYILLLHYRSRPSRMTVWIYTILALALVDTVLFVVFFSLTRGTWGR